MDYVTVDYDGFELAALRTGSGPTVVLVPGATMSIDRWIDAGYVDVLAENRQVVVVDPLGHGRSSKTADVDAYAADHLVAHLIAVLDALELEQADLWGYSRGAQMSAMAALRHPDRVRSLVHGGNVLFDAKAVLAALGMAPDPAEQQANYERAMAGDWEGYWASFPLPLTDEVKADIEGRNDLASIAACGLAGRREGFVFAVPEVPTLAYWGTDEIFHQLNADTAAELGVQTAAIPGGHAEAFDPCGPAIDAVMPFLDSLSDHS